MEKDNLGFDEKNYYDILKKIILRLNALTPRGYSQYVKTLCTGVGIRPEIDEDVNRILSEKVRFIDGKFKTLKREKEDLIPYVDHEKDITGAIDADKIAYVRSIPYGAHEEDITPYGALEIDVNSLYLKLSKANFIRYGGVKNKEEVIFFLILWRMFTYPEIAEELEGAFSLEDKAKAFEGFLRVFKKFGVKIPTFVFDEYEDIILVAWPLWFKSFTFSDELLEMDEKDARRVVLAYMISSQPKGQALYDKLKENAIKQAEESLKASELPTYNWGTTYNWIRLLCEIYAIKYLEKIHNQEGKILKHIPDLQKIWAIPRKTWTDKWNLIAAIDKNL